MRTKSIFIVGVVCSIFCASMVAQDEKKPRTGDAATREQSETSKADKIPGSFSGEELEARFKKLLTNATLSGRWSKIDNAQLGGEAKDDKYEIVGASKREGDQWVINARMRYGQNSMVFPVPVTVKWSGETPMIIVNNLNMGSERSYSARVLFYEGAYAGSWTSSTGHGGVLYGTVDHDSTTPPKSDVPKKPE